MARDSDTLTLALLRRRDARGFDRAYATYAARIHGFLLRLSGRRDVADDLVQHTFLRLVERGPELRADSDLRAWLFTVARNAFLAQTRARRDERDDAALEAVPGPSVDLDARLGVDELERALANLREDDRELLLLVAVEGFEPAEAAALLGIEAPALRQRLARARARLAAELERSRSNVRAQQRSSR